VLESDAPDQPPAWLAGARNEPAELAAITLRVAELRGCSPEQLAERTWHNGCRLFGVG
jgi:TatD DNase family protein